MSTITFALIVTLFTAQPSGDRPATADVMILDRGLTAEDCMRELSVYAPIMEEAHGIYSCSLDYDF